MHQTTTRPSAREAGPDHAKAVTDLGLPTRALTSLRRHGISTIEQLIAWSAEDLRFEVQGLGAVGIKEIEAALARHGLSLAPPTTRSQHNN